MAPRPQRRRDPLFVMLLVQLSQQVLQLEHKPPVTIALMLANFAIFFDDFLPPEVRRLLPSIQRDCLQPASIVKRGQWQRLFLSAFLHADEAHIYYNMSSLLWKGVQLEAGLGSLRFAVLVAELLTVSHSLVVLASYWLGTTIPEYWHLYQSTCAVGFSAVLFGLKVVLNNNSPGMSEVMGISLPTKYICWVELVLASAFNPQASFLGHLCGILAGVIHLRATIPLIRYIKRLIQTGLRQYRQYRREASRPRPPQPQYWGPQPRGYASGPSPDSGGGRGGRESSYPTQPSYSIPSRPPAPQAAPGPAPTQRALSEEELRLRRVMRFDNRS